MPDGFCTLDDVRRALRNAELPGDIQQDKEIAIDAITSQTEWMEKTYKRHWYDPNGITEDDEDLVPSSTKSREDEHDIETHGGYVVGAYDGQTSYTSASGTVFDSNSGDDPEPKEEIRLATGDLEDETVPAYTEIVLPRKDVSSINELSVVNENGGYDDWVSSNDYSGGVGKANRGDDYWLFVDNGGVSRLYIDVHSLDDDIATLANAVYTDVDYGHSGLPRNVRRATAFRAGADLVAEAVIDIPNNASIYNIETKADEMRSQADELLEIYERPEP